MPSRDSLLARTDINTQVRQEAAVGAVSAVSACHCETVLDSTDYRCRPPGPLLPLQATFPLAVAAAAGGGRCRSGRQEQSACRSSRESCSHEASGQACCQSARAIRSLERADNRLAGARGHAARRNPHEISTQTSRRLRVRYGWLQEYHQISGGYGQFILIYAQTRKREQYKVVFLKMLPSGVPLVPPWAFCP